MSGDPPKENAAREAFRRVAAPPRQRSGGAGQVTQAKSSHTSWPNDSIGEAAPGAGPDAHAGHQTGTADPGPGLFFPPNTETP
eukprot:84584-Alexandrium_andersonii.AAC.1